MADENKKQQSGGDEGGKLRIQYYRSAIGFPKTQKEIVRSLVSSVPHLLRIIE
jgi:hypothetical protein